MSAAYVYGGIDRTPSLWDSSTELSPPPGDSPETNYLSWRPEKSKPTPSAAYRYGGIDRTRIDWVRSESPTDAQVQDSDLLSPLAE